MVSARDGDGTGDTAEQTAAAAAKRHQKQRGRRRGHQPSVSPSPTSWGCAIEELQGQAAARRRERCSKGWREGLSSCRELWPSRDEGSQIYRDLRSRPRAAVACTFNFQNHPPESHCTKKKRGIKCHPNQSTYTKEKDAFVPNTFPIASTHILWINHGDQGPTGVVNHLWRELDNMGFHNRLRRGCKGTRGSRDVLDAGCREKPARICVCNESHVPCAQLKGTQDRTAPGKTPLKNQFPNDAVANQQNF